MIFLERGGESIHPGCRAFMHETIGQSAAPKFIPRAHRELIITRSLTRVHPRESYLLARYTYTTRGDRQDKLSISSTDADKSRIPSTPVLIHGARLSCQRFRAFRIYPYVLMYVYIACIQRSFFPFHS